MEATPGSSTRDGFCHFRALLAKDHDGSISRFLTTEMSALPDWARGRIGFALAEHYRETGHLQAIRALFAPPDAEVQRLVLNALWGEPYAGSEMGPGIIALAVEGAHHHDPAVRTEAASVFQNQYAWGVNVNGALDPLMRLLNDPVARVRQQAAYAVGSLAKGVPRARKKVASAVGLVTQEKYDLSAQIPRLVDNLRDENLFVRDASAWGLWNLSKRQYEIAPAVAGLVSLLTSTDEYNEPRKNAAGALLHHAQKSSENRDIVKQYVTVTMLNTERKEIARFLQLLAELG